MDPPACRQCTVTGLQQLVLADAVLTLRARAEGADLRGVLEPRAPPDREPGVRLQHAWFTFARPGSDALESGFLEWVCTDDAAPAGRCRRFTREAGQR